MIKNRILYGDDKEENRKYFEKFLNERNYIVDSVGSHQEFISQATSGKYSALVTDLDYTENGEEGYEIIRKIRNIPSLKIVFTGRSGFENMIEALECGADNVILNKNLAYLIQTLERELKGGEKNDKIN